MGIIYKHTIGNDSYIGYTKHTLEYRLKQHIQYAMRGTKSHFYNKIRKHGVDSIVSEVLEECPDELLTEREKYYIEKFDTYANGMNSTKGGDGGAIRTGMTNSEEHRKKLSLSQKGKPKKNKGNCGKYEKTEEHREKLANTSKQHRWVNKDGETKKVNVNDIAKYLSEGWQTGRADHNWEPGNKGVPMDNEQKQHLSKLHKGKIIIHNPETKITKMVHEDEFINNYINNGFIKGRLKK